MYPLPFTSSFLLLLGTFFELTRAGGGHSQRCRNIPGDAGYPSAATWAAFNASISGRLVNVVPSAKYCAGIGGCSDAQWTSAIFRGAIPGAMDQVNWEQGYDLEPASLCLRNGTTCGQGDVPIYSVEAETVKDVQAAVKFATKHNLRLVVKSTGHDYLGRSTAPHSLLIRVAKFKNITYTEDFRVAGKRLGSAVTLGSGVYANEFYQSAKAQGKIAAVGVSATVAPAGGQIQGGGHSSLSPALGLVSDNALEFTVVDGHGDVLRVNSASNPDLFYAIRGGGSGSWGVLISATIRTFPTFNLTLSTIVLGALSNTIAGQLATVHAQHIFDWDSVHAGQYFFMLKNVTGPGSPTGFVVLTYMPNTTAAQADALLAPWLNASLAIPGVVPVSQGSVEVLVNDALFAADDGVGGNVYMGSRLIPEALYRETPEKVGDVYTQLLDDGATGILGHMVAGGKVAQNADLKSAVHPAWRTAKTHIVIPNGYAESATLEEIRAVRSKFQTSQRPLLEQLSGPDGASYSNEADIEPDFQTTFFGSAPSYAKLSAIKRKYDPHDLFIVAAGVGSERWDQWGLCRV
ncbi:FAD-binding domain-containing protein [Mycena kentingensis (nom. inval.)]|nr:FAD-binding domain-containing protein [Mycena kentingensis (nom. inval.)]